MKSRVPCLIAGCTEDASSKGMCNPHYMRMWRYGDPLASGSGKPRGRPPSDPSTRLWRHVDFSDPEGCWLWTGATRNGYGEISDRRFKQNGYRYAHIVAFESAFGPIPEGMVVCHFCDNPLCVRPSLSHCFLGTQADNLTDMSRKGRWGNQWRMGDGSEGPFILNKELTCEAPECDREVECSYLCNAHFQRYRKFVRAGFSDDDARTRAMRNEIPPRKPIVEKGSSEWPAAPEGTERSRRRSGRTRRQPQEQLDAEWGCMPGSTDSRPTR